MNIEDYIIRALKLIDGDYSSDESDKCADMFKSLYPFTTENITGYFSTIDFSQKEVLTVGGSGDHSLNAILLGASKVDIFDINPLSILYLKLKIAAIISLEYEEFIKFFCYKNYNLYIYPNFNAFDNLVYEKITSGLDNEAKTFWDGLFYRRNGQEIRSSQLFTTDEPLFKALPQINPYLCRNNYYLLRDKLKKFPINFEACNVLDLSKKFKQKYDLIFLSNISKYLRLLYSKDHLENFKSLILEISEMLKDKGELYYGYLYSVEDNEYHPSEPVIYDSAKRKSLFLEPNFTQKNFKGIGSSDGLLSDWKSIDSVLVYQKS